MATFGPILRAPLVAALLGLAGAASQAGDPPARFAPLTLAVAQAAAGDEAVAAFYRARAFAPLWLGTDAADRRAALLAALDGAADHGLPAGRYDADALREAFRQAHGTAAMGAVEVAATRMLVRYGSDVGSGVLDPKAVDPTIRVDVPARDWTAALHAFASGDPWSFVRSLRPTTLAYTRLLGEKLRLESLRAAGGWGPPVPDGPALRAGDDGPRTAALRSRLGAMGYLRPSPIASFDGAVEAAVRAFQADHGLSPDGEIGAATLRALNVPLADRLAQVVVNIERQRWMNKPLEPRHVLVNIAEQHAYVIDDGIATFDTVVVVGSDEAGRRTPEFSDTMTHMVVNPSWYVPRSIVVNEYLPALKRGGARGTSRSIPAAGA